MWYAVEPDAVSRTSAANKAKDHSPARLSVHAASNGKTASKDPSPARVSMKSVKSVNAKAQKNTEHSPARASVKSMQATATATTTAGKDLSDVYRLFLGSI